MFNSRYKCVKQHSEEDCGAACIATIAYQYGKRLAMPKIRELVGTGTGGTTLLGLRRGADALGFHARAVKAKSDITSSLDAVPLPAICHWRGNHWVVLHGQQGKQLIIADPAIGIRKMSHEEFHRGWSNGVMLLLEPDLLRLDSQEVDERAPFLRFLRLLRPYRGLIIQALFINILVGILALSMPLLMQILTDDVLVRRDSQMLASLGLGMLLLFAFRTTISTVQGHIVGHLSQRLLLSLLLDYGYKLFRLPLTYFDSHRSGEVVSRIDDVEQVKSMIGEFVLGLPSQFFIAIISFVVMLNYNTKLTAAALLAFALVTGAGLLFTPAIRQKSQKLVIESADNQGFLVETFRGVQVLKTTDATPQAWAEYQKNFGRLSRLSWDRMQLGLFSSATTGILSSVTTLGMLLYGSGFVISGQLSIGQLLAFNGFTANVLAFLGGLVGFINQYLLAQVVFRRLSDVLDATSEDPQATEKPWIELKATADIKCREISFCHAGRVALLEDFSVTVPGAQFTVIIGESGCGKSTLAKLLSGLYSVKGGNIQYGLFNAKDMPLDCLRKQVVLLPQEASFFNRSILENFRFAYPDVSFDSIIESCQIALADEFIQDLPDGYQTVLGEFGANLSGGQKQRLALARALVANPPILILDEATSGLDPILENRLMERLLQYRRGMTTIMISHRPSVIVRSDWVIYLEKGAVKFEGSPESLNNTPGLVPYLLPS